MKIQNPLKTVNPIIILIMVIGIMLFWFITCCFPIQSFDYFYHLATGRWIIEHQSVPTQDIFSHTAKGQPWTTHEWLSQTLFYVLHLFFNPFWMVIGKAFLGTLIGLLLFVTGHRLNAPLWIISVVCILTAYMTSFRFFIRPHIITYFFLAILVSIVFGFPSLLRTKKRLFLPLFFWLWSNIHSGFVFGVFVFILWMFFDSFQYPEYRKHYFIAGSLSIVAGLINPNFYQVYLYPFRFFTMPIYFNIIAELRPMSSPEISGAIFYYAYWILVFLIGTLLLVNFSKKPLFITVLFLVFASLAFRSVRNVPIFAIICAPGLLQLAAWEKLKWVNKFKFPTFLPMGFNIAALMMMSYAAYVSATHGTFIGQKNYRYFEAGIKELNYPDKALAFIGEQPFYGKIFNSFAFGGYMLWKNYPDPEVFIDGRLFLYSRNIIYDYTSTLKGHMHPDEISTKYNVNYFLLPYPQHSAYGKQYLYDNLHDSTTWKLVYWDDNALIYAHKIHQHNELIKNFEYHLINPFNRSLDQIDALFKMQPEQFKKEAQRATQVNSECSGAYFLLGRAAFLEAEYGDAANNYEKSLTIQPNHRITQIELAKSRFHAEEVDDALNILKKLLSDGISGYDIYFYSARCYQSQKQYTLAEKWYNKALETNPGNSYLLNSMGILYAEQKDYDQARQYWQKALTTDPSFREARNNLGRLDAMMQQEK